MSADIEKMTVMDGRIVQSRPKYAVEKGALSLTNAPFNAIAATQSQMTFNIYVPSENVFVDRKVQWSIGCYQSFSVVKVSASAQGTTTTWASADAVIRPGYDFALTAFPINSLCATLQATINDTTVILNSQDVLKEVLRLTDYKKNRLVRTTPTMLDKYATYNDAFGANNNPLGSYSDSTDYDNIQNGAHPNLYFTNEAGTVGGAYANTITDTNTTTTYTVTTASGLPVVTVASGPGTSGFPLPVYVYWTATEPIVLSPFVFADHCEWDTGLFGINNIQLVANLQPSGQLRTFRSTWAYGRQIVPGSLAFNTAVSGGQVFNQTTLNVTFLTPSLDVPLPPKSVVPYMEFPRYISQPSGALAPGGTVQLTSQTITLPTIPDLLIIYCKPSSGYTIPSAGLSGATGAQVADYQQGDWYLSLGQGTAATSVNSKPLSVNFDNFSGLLSSVTTQELYNMSVKNGLNMDWATWSGQGKVATGSTASTGHTTPNTVTAGTVALTTRNVGSQTPLAGSILVLKPSQDITLQSGQAPSLVGNFTLQFNLQVYNQSDFTVTPQLYVITANSGFFESIRGSSRIIKGVLSEQDIISAPLASMTTRGELDRIVGAGAFHSLANVAHKAMGAYNKSAPASAPSMEGGRRSHGKSLNARLM
jgi:hypothetical protein